MFVRFELDSSTAGSGASAPASLVDDGSSGIDALASPRGRPRARRGSFVGRAVVVVVVVVVVIIIVASLGDPSGDTLRSVESLDA